MRELLLIRHGQASFHDDDYDVLSPLGEQQSRALGQWFAECGTQPEHVAMGPRVRHRDTARLCLEAAGVQATPHRLDGLDEVDHQELLARQRPDLAEASQLREALRKSEDPKRAFQILFVASIRRWMSGEHDAEYRCTWPRFRANVLDALTAMTATPATTMWAFTSGGPIAVMVGTLLQVPEQHVFDLSWSLVNSGITRVRLGSQGASIATYNSWPHLERGQARAWITLR